MSYRFLTLIAALALAGLIGAGQTASAQVNVSLPMIQGEVGEEVTINVVVGDLSGQGVLAYDLTLVYDESIVEITDYEDSGTLSAGKSVVLNPNKTDTVRVVAASATEFSGSGTLITLIGTIRAEGSTDLDVTRFVFNDGDPAATTTDGRLTTANQSPSAANVAATTAEDTAVQLTLSGSDPEGVGLTFAIESQPSNGSLGAITVIDATSARVTYTPDANFSGSDSFTYSVGDGTSTADGTVTLTITAVNDAPGAVGIVSPDEGSVLTVGGETRAGAVGGTTVLFTADWQPAADPEGSQVSYTYQVASDAAFANVIDQRSLGSQTSADVTIAQAASWFDAIHGSSELGASATIYHRVVASDGTLSSTGTGSSVLLVRGTVTGREESGELPDEFTLQGNYPNPFNPSTMIRFDLPAPAEVTVEVTDSAGRRVMFIPGRSYGAGAGHTVDVNASSLVSGTYLYRVIASFGDRTIVRSSSMTLLR